MTSGFDESGTAAGWGPALQKNAVRYELLLQVLGLRFWASLEERKGDWNLSRWRLFRLLFFTIENKSGKSKNDRLKNAWPDAQGPLQHKVLRLGWSWKLEWNEMRKERTKGAEWNEGGTSEWNGTYWVRDDEWNWMEAFCFETRSSSTWGKCRELQKRWQAGNEMDTRSAAILILYQKRQL